MLVLALVLVAAAPSPDDARLLTQLVGTAAQRPDIDVLTSEDLRRAVDLEAERQRAGCSASDCLAEVASALGAGYVVYGGVSSLGDDELILTLSLFESATGTAGGRTTLRGPDLKSLVNQIEPAVHKLVESVPIATSPKHRLLVLDVELHNAAPPPPAPAGINWLLWSGVGVAGVGAAAAGAGAFFDATASGTTSARATPTRRSSTSPTSCGSGTTPRSWRWRATRSARSSSSAELASPPWEPCHEAVASPPPASAGLLRGLHRRAARESRVQGRRGAGLPDGLPLRGHGVRRRRR